ncbi:MAG: dihydroorotate dehydrogenase [Chitinispirillaceae bacterium]|nr:dihydroorotate dehydrogenase [Chitinispirillaceae bacterium]
MLKTDLVTNLAGLKLRTPLLLASGVVGYAVEYEKIDEIDFNSLGGIVLKGVNLHGKKGNPQPRIVDSTVGIINSIGLENPGIYKMIDEILPKIPRKTSIIANIFGDTVQEYGEVAEVVNSISEIHAIEVNISCPNVKRGGRLFGSDPSITREVLHTVRQAYHNRPVIAKLSPGVTDITEIAKAAVDGGADVISLINTMPALAVTLHTKPPKPVLGNIVGGLSGPAIKPIGLAKVYQVHQFFKHAGIAVPIIGIGGIMDATDVLEYMAVGARAVQLGTVMFTNYHAHTQIARGIEEYFKKHGFSSKKTDKFVGSVLRSDHPTP